MGAGASRRDAKQATRLALVEAALDLFLDEGFEGPSLDSICARAGYTRGAFYVHFKDRDELIAASMGHVLDQFLDDVIANEDTGADVEHTVMRFVDLALRPLPGTDLVDGPPLRQILEACRRSDEVQRTFVGVLSEAIVRVSQGAEAGQRDARLRTDLTPNEIARVLVILALGARVVVEVGMPVDVESTRDAALKLLFAPR